MQLTTVGAILLTFTLMGANSVLADKDPHPPRMIASPQVPLIGPTIETSTSGTVTKNGLELKLAKVGTLSIPVGALLIGTKVTFAAKSDLYGASDFNWVAVDDGVSRRMRHYITVNTGSHLVAANLTLNIETTPEFRQALQSGEMAHVFGIFDDGDTQMYEGMRSKQSGNGDLTVTLDAARFIKIKDGTQRSTIVVGAVPNMKLED